MKKSQRDRVLRGVDFLDTYGPEDWRSRIHLDTLNLSDVSNCIIGQIYKQEGLTYRNIFRDDNHNPNNHGAFAGIPANAIDLGFTGEGMDDFVQLKKDWTIYLKEERAADTAASLPTIPFKLNSKTLADLSNQLKALTAIVNSGGISIGNTSLQHKGEYIGDAVFTNGEYIFQPKEQ